jgi:1-acyl-sn-glycerol-3-phosphate acyltransferase
VIPLWLLIALAWSILVVIALRVRALSTRGDVFSGLALLAIRAYARTFHGLRVTGKENIPRQKQAGPLIVVSNHTAGVDPLLIQAACGFEIRWVMAEDMRLPALEPFWEWGGVIFVDRENPSTSPVRRAIGHLRAGGVLGLFPEAHIERPARVLLPFHAGIGAFVKQTGARVLPLIIEGTPEGAGTAWSSLYRPSRSRVRVMPAIEYPRRGMTPAQIAQDLHDRYAEWTGWPTGPAPREPEPAYARRKRERSDGPDAAETDTAA